MPDYIIGQEVASNKEPTSQVYKATHKGENRLPFMNRSFISFSFGGIDIEDFDLIATVSGDRMERPVYASFEDLVSTYDVVHGQFFWGSYYRTNSITFYLATDGIEQRKLDEFKHWFAAGQVRELILAEHPNRAIMARVQEPPQLSVLPFEKKIQLRIGAQMYNTSTTLFKGVITLTLVMDEPHWYSKRNIFGQKDSMGIYRDTWFDVSEGRERSALEIPDAIKICYEDGIPFSSMIQETVLLGGNIFAVIQTKVYSSTIIGITQSEYEENASDPDGGYYQRSEELSEDYINQYEIPEYFKGAIVYDEENSTGARVAGATMDETSGISFVPCYDGSSASVVNFYYAGTAPSPITLKFILQPHIMSAGYVDIPNNNYAGQYNPGSGEEYHRYNTITIEGQNEKKEFNFVAPNLLISFNRVIQIFKTEGLVSAGRDWATVRETIRESVWHSAVRAWANRVIDQFDIDGGSGIIEGDVSGTLINNMSYMLKNAQGNIYPIEFVINGKTGEIVATVSYRSCINANTGAVIDQIQTITTTDEQTGETTTTEQQVPFSEYCVSNVVVAKENAGDIAKSKYLTIEERNYPNATGHIVGWQEGQNYAHRLYHNVPNGLYDVFIDYKNMYL